MTPSPHLAERRSSPACLAGIATLLFLVFGLRAETPPNILFILTDDQRDNTFSSTGHEWVQTPNIDELISKSTRFTNT
jgi:hypothetical protein